MTQNDTNLKKVYMFVNVDWFFFSHRSPIAKSAYLNNIEMSVYTDFTSDDAFDDHGDFDLIQSPISRRSKYFGSEIIELIKSYFLILKNKPDLIHAVTIRPIILLGIVARLTNTPFVGAISGLGPAFNQVNLLQKLRLQFVLLAYKFIYSSKSAVVICQSEHDKNILLKLRVCSESKITLILGSGVDLDKFKPEISIKGKKSILMASRLLLDKGVKEFCYAAKQFKSYGKSDVKFSLAGPIDELSPTSISEQEIRSLCKDCDVEYLGNRSDLNVLLASASLFILPSYYPEGVPKVLLEAAACGTPVITTDHPGCRDAIENEKTGILVEPRNAKAIEIAISNLLDDPDLLTKMGKAGRKLAEDFFDENKVVEAHYKIYHQYVKNTS
jgi:glycosyltransferase involved in cell wall biosynthesis